LISRQFIKSSFIYTVAGTLPLASAVVLLPFYVAYLSTELFGALAIYLALSMLVQILVTFSFDTSLYVHYHDFKADNEKLSTFIGSCFSLMLLLGAGAAGMAALTGEFVFGKLFNSQSSLAFFPYGFLAVITGVFQALFKVNTSLLQSREQPTRFFWANLINFTLIALLTIVGLKLFPNNLAGPVGARAVAAAISGIGALVRIYAEFGLRFNFPLLRSTFGFNAYSFIYQLEVWAVNYLDRMLMVFFLPIDKVGVYDFAFKCMLVVEFTLNGLFNSFFPKVISKVADQHPKGTTIEINRYYHGLTAAAVLLVACCIFMFPIILEFVRIKSGYTEALALMPFIGIIYLLKPLRLYAAMPYSVLKYTRPLPVYYLVVVAVKVLLIFLAVPALNLYGVILASAVALAVEILLLFWGSRNRFTFAYLNSYKLMVLPVIFGAVILLAELLHLPIRLHLLHLMYIVLGLLLLFWVYRNEFRLIDPMRLIR
jgi:O-antigen/teichoic acid export membrane protein